MPRAQLKTEHVDDFFAITERKRHKTPYDFKYTKQTYSVGKMTHDKVKAIAEQEGVGLNDLVRWIFRRFIHGYENGEIEIPVEEYVVTHSRLAD